MKVLVTGSHGFLGRHAAAAATRCGHQLLLLDRATTPLPPGPEWDVVAASIEDTGAWLERVVAFGPEACIHLAWTGIPDFSRHNCVRNLADSIQFFGALVGHTSCRQLLVSGSCWEYGDVHGCCSEEREGAPVSYFAWAKSALRQHLALLCAERSIALHWFRIFFLYGPGQRSGSLIPSLIRDISGGRTPGLKQPGHCNDFVHVHDVAEAFALALGRDAPSGVYNLGSGIATSVVDVLATVEHLLTSEQATAEQVRQRATTTGQGCWADVTRTQRVFGWRARTALADGIRSQVLASGLLTAGAE